MRRELALRVLGEVLKWDDGQAIDEFRWLSLMSRLKYDGYQDFVAGVRFLESLATWLQQFPSIEDRRDAYAFLRQDLIYVGEAEMQHLVEIFYPEFVERRLRQAVADRHDIAPYRVWARPESYEAFNRLLRQTLFIGLSEGARLDLLRRGNPGAISHEQVLQTIHADPEKWRDVLEELRRDLKDDVARFHFLYLIDDFTASGTTFIRKKDGIWKGKLERFRSSVAKYRDSHFDSSLTVCVHHHLASYHAKSELSRRHEEALEERGPEEWFSKVEFTFGTVLPEKTPLTASGSATAASFLALARKHCDREDPLFDNRHFREGNTKDPALGFADCALPLVLEHNTPNNSMALLWAETAGATAKVAGGAGERHAMRPLFRRRQRHQ